MNVQDNIHTPHFPRNLSTRVRHKIEQACAYAKPVSLKQAWRQSQDPAFLPASAQALWKSDLLWVFAQLNVRDIHNEVRHSNEEVWLKGNTFEIFSDSPNSERYLERHASRLHHHTLGLICTATTSS